jgi:hypothetical protein
MEYGDFGRPIGIKKCVLFPFFRTVWPVVIYFIVTNNLSVPAKYSVFFLE